MYSNFQNIINVNNLLILFLQVIPQMHWYHTYFKSCQLISKTSSSPSNPRKYSCKVVTSLWSSWKAEHSAWSSAEISSKPLCFCFWLSYCFHLLHIASIFLVLSVYSWLFYILLTWYIFTYPRIHWTLNQGPEAPRLGNPIARKLQKCKVKINPRESKKKTCDDVTVWRVSCAHVMIWWF